MTEEDMLEFLDSHEDREHLQIAIHLKEMRKQLNRLQTTEERLRSLSSLVNNLKSSMDDLGISERVDLKEM